MRKFFLGFAVGIAFVALAFIVFVAILFFATGNRQPRVEANSALILDLRGDLPEQSAVEFPIPGFQRGGHHMTVAETWQTLRHATNDPKIKALIIEPQGLNVGWAKLQELHSDILAFKKSGKPVYAYLRGAGTKEYYLATAADRILMAPEDELDVKGMRAELMYLKGTLDKLGVQMEFEHVGKYKDAPDMFTKTGSSPETREVLNQLLDQFYGDFINTVATGRKQTPESVRAIVDRGPFVGKQAVDDKLVDALLYGEQALDQLKEQLKLKKLETISVSAYFSAVKPEEGGSRVALLVGQGEITRGESSGYNDNDGIRSVDMIRRLRQVRDDDSIKGVILRVDSPGGDGIASDDILHEVKLLSQKKPLIISMSDLAASGGYFIAMSGDPILAYPNTETGSIGVFFGKANLRGLYDKLGLNKEILKRGQFADIDTDYSALNDTQRAKLRTEIEIFYKSFVELVAGARKRKYGDVEPLAQGRVWTGTQGKQNGLVDELGGLDRAIEMIRERAKLSSGDKINLVAYPGQRSILDLLFDRDGDFETRLSSLIAGPIQTGISAKLRELTGDLPLGSLSRGGILRLRTFSVVVK